MKTGRVDEKTDRIDKKTGRVDGDMKTDIYCTCGKHDMRHDVNVLQTLWGCGCEVAGKLLQERVQMVPEVFVLHLHLIDVWVGKTTKSETKILDLQGVCFFVCFMCVCVCFFTISFGKGQTATLHDDSWDESVHLKSNKTSATPSCRGNRCPH